tara:strand:- start:771 stop:1193 length:423 start_codon:yes stop_codon:yes gene_type:complete
MKPKTTAIFLILFLQAFNQVSANPEQTFTVYCTGNHDTTGTCLKISNSEEAEEFDCIMVPGNIIDCKSNSDTNIECILISASSAQAEFSCSRDNTKSLTSPELTSGQDPDYQENFVYDDKKGDSNNAPGKPQSSVFDNPF